MLDRVLEQYNKPVVTKPHEYSSLAHVLHTAKMSQGDYLMASGLFRNHIVDQNFVKQILSAGAVEAMGHMGDDLGHAAAEFHEIAPHDAPPVAFAEAAQAAPQAAPHAAPHAVADVARDAPVAPPARRVEFARESRQAEPASEIARADAAEVFYTPRGEQRASRSSRIPNLNVKPPPGSPRRVQKTPRVSIRPAPVIAAEIMPPTPRAAVVAPATPGAAEAAPETPRPEPQPGSGTNAPSITPAAVFSPPKFIAGLEKFRTEKQRDFENLSALKLEDLRKLASEVNALYSRNPRLSGYINVKSKGGNPVSKETLRIKLEAARADIFR